MLDYADWNEAIGRWFLHDGVVGETVRLTVDAPTLRQCMHTHRGYDEFDSDEQAKFDFVEATRKELADRGFRWFCVSRPEPDVYPDFLGLIAVQVLAVYEMDDDPAGRFTSKAYWQPLASLLQLELAGNLPSGFTYKDQKALWRGGLEHWANRLQEGRWGRIELPLDSGGHRYVRLPLSQALLRTADLKRLHELFKIAELCPGDSVSQDRIKRELRWYRNHPGIFSRHARRVLDDPERLELVCDQVLLHFKQWDGRVESLQHVVARPKRREIEFSLGITREDLPRLIIRIEDLDQGKTHPLSDGEITELLGGEKVNRVTVGGLELRPYHRYCLLAVYDDARNKYLGQASARPGDRILLLVHWNHLQEWLATVEHVARAGTLRKFHVPGRHVGSDWRALRALPADWALFQLQVSPDLQPVPEPWARLIDLKATRLRSLGGLRLSRREWLAGVGPLIHVEGAEIPDEVFIDDEPFPVQGGLVVSSRLNEPGVHIVSLRQGDSGRGTRLRIIVREAHQPSIAEPFVGGWLCNAEGWPTFYDEIGEDTRRSAAYMVGANVYGTWPAVNVRRGSPEREAIALLLRRQEGVEMKNNRFESDHPIVKSLRDRGVASAARMHLRQGDC